MIPLSCSPLSQFFKLPPPLFKPLLRLTWVIAVKPNWSPCLMSLQIHPSHSCPRNLPKVPLGFYSHFHQSKQVASRFQCNTAALLGRTGLRVGCHSVLYCSTCCCCLWIESLSHLPCDIVFGFYRQKNMYLYSFNNCFLFLVANIVQICQQ